MIGKRLFLVTGLLLVLAGMSGTGPAHASAGSDDTAAILTEMHRQQSAWNRGDVEDFMRGYRDSPETTFVGTSVRKGYREILADYRRHYATRQQMGRLTFSGLDVRLLPGSRGELRYAAVTGHFHLERTAHGEAARDDGVFSLLWQKTTEGWKIILGHTS